MASTTFRIDEFTGGDTQAEITLVEQADGSIQVTVTAVADPDTGYIGDLRGVFFHIADESLISTLSITGANVTDSQFAANSVINLGGGATLEPSPGFDFGVEIGVSGIGGNPPDDFRTTTFKIANSTPRPLTLADFADANASGSDIGVRMTSVGIEGGDRSDSSKLSGEIPKTFSISGTKFEDKLGDGKTGDDSGWNADQYGGVTIYIDDNGSGSFDAGERSTVTGSNGVWSISGLTAADVNKSIRELVPTGSEQTGILFQTITNPGSGGIDAGNDFTNFRNFAISGTKFEDKGDGTTGTWTYGAVTIYIDDNRNGSFDTSDRTTTTDGNGAWSIAGLTLADVGKTIYEVVPAGSEQTGILFQTIANPGSGGTDAGNDFTNFRNFAISGTKFEDITGDGKTGDDVAWTYGAVTIYIDDNRSGSFDTSDRSVTTGANGTWSIAGLTLADVGKQIYEVAPSGSMQTGILAQTIDNPGSGGTDTGNDFTNFKLKGPGVGTQGFWSNRNGTAAWNTLTSQKLVDDPATTATTLVEGLLIGDIDRNGQTNAGESTIFYTNAEARAILAASSVVDGQDSRYILTKQLIASWLNVLAGNPYSVGTNSIQPEITNGVKWLQKATADENGDGLGDGNLTLQPSTYRLPSSNARWSTTLSPTNSLNGTTSAYGASIKNVLAYYNETGAGLALDRDTNTVAGSLTTLTGLQAYRPYF
jgi:hypothetical protein